MVVPYFTDGSVTIYLGDSRIIIPEIDGYDLVVTDPPYGIDYQSGWCEKWQQKPKIQNDLEYPLWMFDVLKPRLALYSFCRWDNFYTLPKPKSFIVWDKGGCTFGDLAHEHARTWEGIAFYPGPEHEFIHRPCDVIHVPKVAAPKLSHPNEKPVALIKALLAPYRTSCVVFDPFMGSGAVLRAAKDLGYKAIGIDIEERYCNIAAKRMSQAMLFTTGDK